MIRQVTHRGGAVMNDSTGKIPLALQQLALARTRAQESGDSALAKIIGDKMEELIANI